MTRVATKPIVTYKLPSREIEKLCARVMDPDEVKVVVYSARNLQPKKGHGICNASVIFGIGKHKYRTEFVRDNDPTWNEETIITVAKPAPLVFTVTDRDDTLGTASLPLAQIPSVAHRRRWLPLTTKSSQAMGDLCIDCWVLSFKKHSSVGESVKWNNLIPFRNSSRDRSSRRSSIEAASISRRGSRSVENLYSNAKLMPNDAPAVNAGRTSPKASPVLSPSTSATSLRPFALFKPRLAPTLGQVLSSSNTPEITGLSPKSGPSTGGTRITVRGCNLGKSKEDIVSISICGSDLYPTLEYHSPAKLVVVTKPWAGSGPVALETKSGGRGTSTLNFTFLDKQAEPVVSALDRKGKVPRAELLTEITKLKEEIVDLNGENRSLKDYIDRLMIVLMEKFPQVLENIGSS